MFNFEGFGQRLQQLRKQKKMTQEDLADKMGVTGQAVSKWETGLSYPDITIIPTLATVLGTEIDFLFGKEIEEKTISHMFEGPETYGGLPFIMSLQNVGCYSNKKVASSDETGVKFTDGSTAELLTKVIVNVGQGEIKLLNSATDEYAHFDQPISENHYEFGYTSNIDINVAFCNCKIVCSKDDKTRVTAKGPDNFLSLLVVQEHAGTLTIGWKESSLNSANFKTNLDVIIEMPCETGDNATIKINGNNTVVSELDFRVGTLSMNGSGDIVAQSFTESCSVSINGSGVITGIYAPELNLSVNGSGEIIWKTADKAKISINGSGCITLDATQTARTSINGSGDLGIKNLTGCGDFSAKIAGSGNIGVESGNCEKFDVDMTGSGEIDATGLTARRARIVLHHSGDITLGRVLETSTEQIKKKGSITVLKRG